MHLQNNTLLQGGKYKIVRFIASGGFGCTYEAHHTLLDSRIALKEFFISDFCNRDESTGQVTVVTKSKVELIGKLKKKFMDEARSLFKMKHPGIVRVIDVFEENGTAYYAMEYIDGESLGDLVKRKRKLSETEAVGYIRQVAEALKYVHSLNRLHLDIKPGNIMLNREGRAMLIDFGASKHYDDETGENTSTLLGINTKGYAPVEQVNQSFKSFSPATDIYALGATLYKLLTGITPPPSTLLHSEEATLDPLPSSISPSTRQAVEAAMQLLRKKRPQSVEEWTRMLHIPVSHTKSIDKESKDNTICEDVVEHVHIIKDINQKESKGILNGHEWVDLGLSVVWATCNVGADKPEDYGDYFAWGEINTPKIPNKFWTWLNKNSRTSGYIEANCKTYRMNIGDIAGNSQYDAARANWGSPWRLPTKDECQELLDKCDWKWMEQGGNFGFLVVSKMNGNYIYLPAAGSRYGTKPNFFEGEEGNYWSSSPDENNTEEAYSLYFELLCGDSDSPYIIVASDDRSIGYSVRPVLNK